MADTFQIEIATPEKMVLDKRVEYAEIPGKDGYMGILPGHAPLLSELASGILTYRSGGRVRRRTNCSFWTTGARTRSW